MQTRRHNTWLVLSSVLFVGFWGHVNHIGKLPLIWNINSWAWVYFAESFWNEMCTYEWHKLYILLPYLAGLSSLGITLHLETFDRVFEIFRSANPVMDTQWHPVVLSLGTIIAASYFSDQFYSMCFLYFELHAPCR